MAEIKNSGTLIEATTSAVASGSGHDAVFRKGANVCATNLAGGEEVDLYRVNQNGTTTTLYLNGSPAVLTATQPQLSLIGPLKLRVAKDATASSCAVEIDIE